MRPRRRRTVLLLACSAGCGLAAAAGVRDTVRDVESRTGSPVPVVVARADLPAGARLDERVVARSLEVREVPARYAPRDALGDPAQALGLETAVPLRPGSYVTAAMVGPPGGERATAPPVARGQRLLEIAVTGGGDLPDAGRMRVDVLVTTEGRDGGGRTVVALENVELLAARPAKQDESEQRDGTAVDTIATLRVSARSAVFLTAAQNFAREVRLLARPAGDRGRVGRAEVTDGRL